MTKRELLEALQRAGCRLTQQEQDVLWEAMDTNQDGTSVASECLGGWSAQRGGAGARGIVSRGRCKKCLVERNAARVLFART